MGLIQNFMRSMRVAHSPDLVWVGKNLAPALHADVPRVGGGMAGRVGSRRGFLFDGHDIEMNIRYAIGLKDPDTVNIRQMDFLDLAFNFQVRKGRGYGSPVMEFNRRPDHLIDEVAARLRAFGEFYISEPVRMFDYGTPGEYMEWPSREVIEPPRDPSYIPLEEIDAEAEPWLREISLSNVLHGADREARLAAEERIRAHMDLRKENMAKTTHGRWLARNEAYLDRYFERLGETTFNDPSGDADPEP